MKNLKTFEYFTSSSTLGNEFDYNKSDEPELSEVVINIITYLDNNMDRITDVNFYDGDKIELNPKSEPKIFKVRISSKNGRYYTLDISYKVNDKAATEYDTYDITKIEFEHLKKVFYKCHRYYKEHKEQRHNKIHDMIKPENIEADKFNL